MDSAEKYVYVDEHGVMRVGKTRVMLDSVVIAFSKATPPNHSAAVSILDFGGGLRDGRPLFGASGRNRAVLEATGRGLE